MVPTGQPFSMAGMHALKSVSDSAGFTGVTLILFGHVQAAGLPCRVGLEPLTQSWTVACQ
jgi:hypothetical protein